MWNLPDQLDFTLPTYRAWWWMVPVLWLAFFLGAHYLTVDDLWTDEVTTLQDVGGTPYPAMTFLDVLNNDEVGHSNHPPGYFIAMLVWGNLAGWSVFSLRAFSLLPGVLAVAVTYRLGRNLFSASIGLYAAVILGSSSFFVFYMHEARGYTLLALLTVFTIWMYWILTYSPSRPGWAPSIGFVVGSVALPNVSFWGLVVLGALALYHLVFVSRSKRWWILSRLALIAGILILPTVVLLSNARALGGLPDHKQAPSPVQFVELILTIFSHANLPLLVIVGTYGLLRLRDHNLRAVWFLVLSMVGFYLLANLYKDLIPGDRMRYVIPLWPLLALLVAVGIERLVQYGLRPELIVSVWLAVAIPNTWRIGFMREVGTAGAWTPYWSKLAESVQEKETLGDALVIVSHYRIWGNEIPYYMSSLTAPYAYISSWRGEIDPEQTGIEEATSLAKVAGRIWVAYDHDDDPYASTAFHDELKQNFMACARTAGGPDFKLWEYDRVSATPLVSFGDAVVPVPGGLSLNFLRIEPRLAAQTTTITMGWSAAQHIDSDTFGIRLDVVDAQGEVKFTDAFMLPAITQTCIKHPLSTSDLVPGEYTVWLQVYAWNAPLPGLVAGETATANRFQVGAFTRETPR